MVLERWLRQLRKLLKIQPKKITKSKIDNKLERAHKQYYKYKEDAEDLRMTFLQEKAIDMEDKSNNHNKKIKKII